MDEIVLLESPTMRNRYCKEEYLAILDKVGQLATIPGTAWASTEQVAEFYEVPVSTILNIVKRHRHEFLEDGYKILSKKDLEKSHDAIFEIPNRGLGFFPRRAVLRTGMILRDSKIAKQVRSYLLNIEEQAVFTTHDKNVLKDMANQLNIQAIELSHHAKQLRESAEQTNQHSDQIIAQSYLIKAVVDEIYRDRDRIDKLDKKVIALENTVYRKKLPKVSPCFHSLEASQYITKEQIRILKAKVQATGQRAVTVWSKFNKHFAITRFCFLPKSKFQEAVEWIDAYGKSE